MTVGELITKLTGLDPDMLVVVQKDHEGNGCSPLSGVDDNAIYIADTKVSGDAVSADDFDGDVGVTCVVLYPMN